MTRLEAIQEIEDYIYHNSLHPKISDEALGVALLALKKESEKAVAQHDNVKHPSHYCRGGIECRDAISAWELNFNRGCAVKYIMRAGHKDPGKEIEDLKKAVCCLEHEINILEGKDVH